jgi:hypothetical protein
MTAPTLQNVNKAELRKVVDLAADAGPIHRWLT